MEWQPIGTAPKDIDVLVCAKFDGDRQSVMMVAYMPTQLDGEWCTRDGGIWNGTGFNFWMPLPEPPEAK